MSQDLFKDDPSVARFSAADIYRNLEVAALQDIAKRFEEADNLVDILEPAKAKPAALPVAEPIREDAEIILLPVGVRKTPEIVDEAPGPVDLEIREGDGDTASAQIIQLFPSVQEPQPAVFDVTCIPAAQYRCQLGQVAVSRPVAKGVQTRSPSSVRLNAMQRARMTKRNYRAPVSKVKPSQPRRFVRLV